MRKHTYNLHAAIQGHVCSNFRAASVIPGKVMQLLVRSVELQCMPNIQSISIRDQKSIWYPKHNSNATKLDGKRHKQKSKGPAKRIKSEIPNDL